jgi:hypothetical protein
MTKIYRDRELPAASERLMERTNATTLPAGWAGGEIHIDQIAKAIPDYPRTTRTTEEPTR